MSGKIIINKYIDRDNESITPNYKGFDSKLMNGMFFEAIFEKAALGIGVVNMEGKCVRCNKELTGILGYTEDELSQSAFTEFTHPDDRDLDLQLFKELIEGKRSYYKMEKRYIKKSGEFVWARLTASLISDSPDDFGYVIGMVEDITESKKTMQEAENSESKVKEILESISDAFFTLDKNYDFIYVNKQAGKLLQVKPHEVIGKNIWEEFPRIRGSFFEEQYCKAVKEQKAVSFEAYFPPWRSWYTVHAYPTNNSLSVYFRDITEQKQLNERLKESEEQLQLIFDETPNGIAIVNMDGGIRMINKAAEELLGATRNEAYGRKYDDSVINIFTLSGERLPSSKTPFSLVVQDKRAVKNVEFIVKKTDGTEVILSCSASPMHDSDGNIYSVLLSMTDVTEIRRAEQRAQELNLKLSVLSNSDVLTRIGNRRSFDECIDREWKRCSRNGNIISLIMIDIDYFKRYNDTYGHIAGDKCLKKVASTLKSVLKRPGDFVCRFGGEEFVVVLPGTEGEGAEIVAERMRKTVEELRIPHAKSKVNEFVTISLGVAAVETNQQMNVSEILEKVDKALYEAKQKGRNQVSVYKCQFQA